MGTFPTFSNIAGYATKTLENRVKGGVYDISKLNAWIRITSAVSDKTTDNPSGTYGDGLTIVSNPNFKLFGAAGGSVYGSTSQSGTIGTNWDGKAVNPSTGKGYRPNPIVENIEIDEGAGNLSRKANFTIKCFSKEQLNLVTRYFQEPGFTIFLEWGWNTANSMKGLATTKKLDADTISNFQNFKNLTKLRKLSSGEYDNYLGFITGGGISSDGSTWTVEVRCTGFTELPAYLVNGDNAGKKDGEKPTPAPDYKNLSVQTDLNIKRWQFAFNALPSNRKTPEIKALGEGGVDGTKDDSLREIPIAHAVNYINFDEAVANVLNKKADGNWFSRGSGGAQQDGQSAKIPAGTEIFGPEKFIRFGTLMKIFNQMIMKGLKIGKKTVSMSIYSDTTICTAYPRIFSGDKSKLFIPNPRTPKFDFISAQKSKEELNALPPGGDDFETDCSVSFGGEKIQFPFEKGIIGSSVEIGPENIKYLSYKDDFIKNEECIDKDQGFWGLLDDLYVNFDFAASIMKTSNFVVKDALYQILNGMSSAVNDLWNFQIVETTLENPKTLDDGTVMEVGDIILSIKDLNFTYKPTTTPYKFEMEGVKSIFKESSLSMDMGGSKMAHIVGKRLSAQINDDTQPVLGKIFADDLSDLVLNSINAKKEVINSGGDGTGDVEETDEELIEQAYLSFLGKLGMYPKVNVERSSTQVKQSDIQKAGNTLFSTKFDINEFAYVASYDDAELQKLAKADLNSLPKDKKVSVLLPITFTFVIHGVSGIKRGDRFVVNGIPEKYQKQGFFQVLGVKHTIQEMQWVTEVIGGYRNFNY